jgi:hypothetical protein
LCRPSNASLLPQYKQQFAVFKKKYEDMQYTTLKAGATTTSSSSSASSSPSRQRQQLDQTSKENVQRLEKSSGILTQNPSWLQYKYNS